MRSNVIHQSKHQALIRFCQSYCLTFISLFQCCALALNCAFCCALLSVIHLRSTERNGEPRQEIIPQKQTALKTLLRLLILVSWDCT